MKNECLNETPFSLNHQRNDFAIFLFLNRTIPVSLDIIW